MALVLYAAILAVVLAVARDVPILNLPAIPDVDAPTVPTTLLSFSFLVAMLAGWGPSSPRMAASGSFGSAC